MAKQINVDYEFQNGAKPKNVPASTGDGELIEHVQFNTAMDSKQDNLHDSNTVVTVNNTPSVRLADSDYRGTATIDITYAPDEYFDGDYTKYELTGRFNTSGGYVFDSSSNHSVYYRTHTDGKIILIAYKSSNSLYYIFHTGLTDISQLSDGTNIGYQFETSEGEGNDYVLGSAVETVDGTIYYVGSYITYSGGAGNNSFLESTSEGLKVKAITDLNNASSDKLVSSDAVKNYIDDGLSGQDSASDISYSGSHPNVQSKIDSIDTNISNNDTDIAQNVTDISINENNIDDINTVVGTLKGQTSISSWNGSGASFLASATTIKEGIEGAALGANAAFATLGTVAGLSQGEADFGDLGANLPANSDIKTIFLAIDSNIANLSQGVGVYWTPVEAHSDDNINIVNPGTSTFGGATVAQGDRVLLIGQSDDTENGIYIFDTNSTALVRSVDADSSTDFAPNKTVQVERSSDDGISGATFAYNGVDDPTIGSTSLPFSLKSKGVVGDSTISEAKLTSTLADKIDNKKNKHEESIALVSTVWTEIAHNLDISAPIVTAYGSTGEVEELEVRKKDGTNRNIIEVRTMGISETFDIGII